MGAKISIDSATLMNKGLELIEAHHLFPVGLDQLDVIVHPQSVVHSMVEYVDGSVLAQLGTPDMRIPIAYAMAWPERIATPAARLDLAAIGRLEFEAPDLERFPCLALAWEAMRAGGSAPCILNAANEIAVAAFIAGQVAFPRYRCHCCGNAGAGCLGAGRFAGRSGGNRSPTPGPKRAAQWRRGPEPWT